MTYPAVLSTYRALDPDPGWTHVGFWAAAVMVLGAPLIRGGNRGVALIALEWLSLVVLLVVLARVARGEGAAWGRGATRWGLLCLAGAPLWVACLQLAPLPADLWAALPGRAFYQEIQLGLGLAQPAWRPASLMPDVTRVSVLAGIPVVACLALGLTTSRDRVYVFFRLWIAGALLQALLGLAQLGPSKVLLFGSLFTGVIGTFANSNHFAGFIAMSLPLVYFEFRRSRRHPGSRSRSEGVLWLWGLVLFALLSALVATRSRGGLAAAMIVGIATVLVLPGSNDGFATRKWRLVALMGLVALAAAALGIKGLSALAVSASERGLTYRQSMVMETWAAAREFWPVGSGLGSFSGIYPRFQTGIPGRELVEYAHSDYVQLLMETGLLGVVLACVALVLLVVQGGQMLRLIRSGADLRTEQEAMVVAGAGLLALLLHAWVDFNMRIPALAMLGAFLMGVFLRQGVLERPGRSELQVLGQGPIN